MRKGYGSQILLDANGGLIAFATGADFCAEHEMGSQPLMSELTSQVDVSDSVVQQLKAGTLKAYPQLRDLKRFDYKRAAKRPQLQFHHLEVPGKPPEVLFGYSDAKLLDLLGMLTFTSSSREDQSISGAWDEGNFAIRVRGETYVNAMLGFRKSLEEGHGLFAGTFIKENPNPDAYRRQLTGVIIGDETRFTPEIDAAIEDAQKTFEKSLRLKAFGDIENVRRAVYEAGHRKGHSTSFLHIWAAWASDADETIAYRVNTGRIGCSGFYSKEALIEWAAAGYEGEPIALS